LTRFYPIHVRHRNVQHNDLWTERQDLFNGLLACLGLSHNFDIRVGGEQYLETPPKEVMIVGQHN
jgi:hypothetical protein